jgi:hypothetical protein
VRLPCTFAAQVYVGDDSIDALLHCSTVNGETLSACIAMKNVGFFADPSQLKKEGTSAHSNDST